MRFYRKISSMAFHKNSIHFPPNIMISLGRLPKVIINWMLVPFSFIIFGLSGILYKDRRSFEALTGLWSYDWLPSIIIIIMFAVWKHQRNNEVGKLLDDDQWSILSVYRKLPGTCNINLILLTKWGTENEQQNVTRVDFDY